MNLIPLVAILLWSTASLANSIEFDTIKKQIQKNVQFNDYEQQKKNCSLKWQKFKANAHQDLWDYVKAYSHAHLERENLDKTLAIISCLRQTIGAVQDTIYYKPENKKSLGAILLPDGRNFVLLDRCDRKYTRGSFKRYYRGIETTESLPYAILQSDIDSRQARKAMVRELETIQTFNNTGAIPRTYEIYISGNFDRNNKSSMQVFLFNQNYTGDLIDMQNKLNMSSALRLLSEAAEQLAIVHEKGYYHRDLKPENLLIRDKEDQFTISLTDFGLTLHKNHKNFGGNIAGTDGFVAPDLMDRRFHHGSSLNNFEQAKAADTFGLGMIFINYILGTEHPYHQAIKTLNEKFVGGDEEDFPTKDELKKMQVSVELAYKDLPHLIENALKGQGFSSVQLNGLIAMLHPNWEKRPPLSSIERLF